MSDKNTMDHAWHRERAEAAEAALAKWADHVCESHAGCADLLAKAQARLAKVVEALRVAREYVKATEGQLVTRPNIVTNDRELCDAALAAARGEEGK